MKHLFLIILAFLLFPAQSRAVCNYHNVSGYIWSGNTGWISLNCRAGGTVDYGLDINFESGSPTVDVTGYAWSYGLGWLNFDPVIPYPALPNYPARFVRNEGELPTTTAGVLKGWAKWVALGDNGWMKLSSDDGAPIAYSVGIGADRLFSGWSWNGGEDVDSDLKAELGDGWVMWDSDGGDLGGIGGGASILSYWFETLYGSIYSGGNIDAPFAPPSGMFNAMYLIQANGSIAPVSIQSGPKIADEDREAVPYISESHDAFVFPDSANKYRGTLGWVDKAGLLAGRYGEVTEYSGTKTSNTIGKNVTLDGGVYRYTGNVTVDKATTFKKGDANSKGSGTIIVDGDLTIEENITYQTGAIGSSLDRLPSVAWLVKGTIYIDPSVSEVVGLFYSEDDTTDGDGKYGIRTGTTGDLETDVQLIVNGMFIAKKIYLERVWIDVDQFGEVQSDEPAEKIFFDGRAIANPPPGLSDISKGLPVMREIRP